jgi:hypothetical protein
LSSDSILGLERVHDSVIFYRLLWLDKINAIKEGAEMNKNAVKKGEAAKYMQVSLPTLRKFLKQHQDFLDEKLVDIDKVNKWMEEESIKNLEKRGKVQ